MTSDQTFRKPKKRAKKAGVNPPALISRKGSRWFLIDKMGADPPPSPLLRRLLEAER